MKPLEQACAICWHHSTDASFLPSKQRLSAAIDPLGCPVAINKLFNTARFTPHCACARACAQFGRSSFWHKTLPFLALPCVRPQSIGFPLQSQLLPQPETKSRLSRPPTQIATSTMISASLSCFCIASILLCCLRYCRNSCLFFSRSVWKPLHWMTCLQMRPHIVHTAILSFPHTDQAQNCWSAQRMEINDHDTITCNGRHGLNPPPICS